MTSYLLVVNPVSGAGRGRANAKLLADGLEDRARVEIVDTTERGSATDLTATLGGGFDRVIAVGGDGTLNEVLFGLRSIGPDADALPELGLLPSGTANAAARAFRLESDAERLARVLPTADARAVDVGVAGSGSSERPFLLWCGAGYDAVVIERLNASRTGRMGLVGLARNAPGVAIAIARYGEPPVRATVDGASWGERAGVVVANVADIAFGATIARGADPFDGRLDVVAAATGAKWRLPGMAVSMVAGRLHRVRSVRSGRATRICLDAHGRVPFQVDGEPAGTLPVDVRVEPGRVRLLETGEV